MHPPACAPTGSGVTCGACRTEVRNMLCGKIQEWVGHSLDHEKIRSAAMEGSFGPYIRYATG